MMMKNNTFEEIAEVLASAGKVLIFPHINADGDAIGSSAALCRALRSMGKECHILIEDEIAGNLRFLDDGLTTSDAGIMKADVSVCVDCGETGRFPLRAEKFAEAPVTVCIDHHETSKGFCTYNHIDPSAAATAQLIFRLIKAMGVKIDKAMGEAVFAGILTDTGSFRYSNTQKETHLIAAELYDSGIDAAGVAQEIFETVRIERLLVENRAIETMVTLHGGKSVLAYVTQQMLRETGASMDETEGVVGQLRSIAGVELAVFLKEYGPEEIKVSLRSKKYVDVAKFSSDFNGGGHERAAGFTLRCPIAEAFDRVKEYVNNMPEMK